MTDGAGACATSAGATANGSTAAIASAAIGRRVATGCRRRFCCSIIRVFRERFCCGAASVLCGGGDVNKGAASCAFRGCPLFLIAGGFVAYRASVLRLRGASMLRLRGARERGEDKRAGEEDLLHRGGAKSPPNHGSSLGRMFQGGTPRARAYRSEERRAAK